MEGGSDITFKINHLQNTSVEEDFLKINWLAFVVPESPVMLAVGLNVAKIEAKTLGDVQDIAKVKTNGVEEHRGHADFI